MNTKVTLECVICGEDFVPYRDTQIYCSKSCRNVVARDAHDDAGTRVGRVQRGAASELVVSADLLMKGFDVFRAVAASCSCDLMALKDGISYRIEVKTGNYHKGTGKLNYPKPDITKYDILAVVVPGDSPMYMSPEGAVLSTDEFEGVK